MLLEWKDFGALVAGAWSQHELGIRYYGELPVTSRFLPWDYVAGVAGVGLMVAGSRNGFVENFGKGMLLKSAVRAVNDAIGFASGYGWRKTEQGWVYGKVR